MKLKYRIQEWLADRFASVQYPNITAANSRTRGHSGPHWNHKMPFMTRMLITTICFMVVVICLVILGAFGVAIYSVLMT